MELKITRTFFNAFESLTELRDKIGARVSELGSKIRSNPEHWADDFKTIESFIDARVFRDVVSDGGTRMIFAVDGSELTLLDVSDHDVYDDWNQSKKRKNKAKQLNRYENRYAAPEVLTKKFEGVQEVAPLNLATPQITEYSARWLLQLDEEQQDLKDQLIFDFILEPHKWTCHVILGSAGTGKTSLLLSLLLDLDDEGVPTVLYVPSGVETALKESKLDLPNVNGDARKLNAKVALIDDPLTPELLRLQLESLNSLESLTSVVIAIDPFQWSTKESLNALQNLRHVYQMWAHELFVNYRQREIVAQRCIEVSKSMFRSVEEQFGSRYSGLLSNVSFSQKGGGVDLKRVGHVEETKAWVRNVAMDANSWTWTRPHLIVWYHGTDRPELRDLFKNQRVRHVSEDDAMRVRGMEFQTVLIFMPNGLADLIAGSAQNLGDKTWQRRSDFHTFISRAKDLVKIIEVR